MDLIEATVEPVGHRASHLFKTENYMRTHGIPEGWKRKPLAFAQAKSEGNAEWKGILDEAEYSTLSIDSPGALDVTSPRTTNQRHARLALCHHDH